VGWGRDSALIGKGGVGGEISLMTISSRDAIRYPEGRRLKHCQNQDAGHANLDE
jgi:hypothetical protein